ncbi:group I intron endonuclease [Paraburkholderia phenoliruptrix]|uniref:GIY-YIG nuclease family protein n=1 Tax=Paraburkholderia phenoliruptrix TaxID=252970 RepID=UPI00285BDC7A|nr:GIY-YIG nuclease family protein [Paraburkholderia phenoliruptrix]MDR6421332.1 group I intron endonuclease [Paraburkholderia phenoliruptrix]
MRRISEAEKSLKAALAGKSGVYLMRSPSGDCYVGGTGNLWRRYIQHKGELKRREHGSKSLQMEVDLHGFESISFEVLLFCAKTDLLLYEQRAIDALNPKHNSDPTAGSRFGSVASDSARKKMSAAKKGKPSPKRTEEGRARLAAAAKARWADPEFRAKAQAAMKGKTKSAEHRAKLSAANIGKTLSAEHREKIGASNRTTNALLKERREG